MIYLALIGFAALWSAALLAGPQVGDLRVAAWHHAHIGVALWAIGTACGWPVLAWLGVGVLADDGVQHAFQRWHDPASRYSLLHWIYGKTLYRLAWVRRLNQWLDGGVT